MSQSRNLSGCQVFHSDDLPAEWACVPLGDRTEFCYGRALKDDLRKDGHVVVYGSNGAVGTHNIEWLQEPGIVIGRKGSVGAVHLVKTPYWPIDTAYYVKASARDDFGYLFHLLHYLPLTFLNAATGVPGLSRRDAYALRGAFPRQHSEQAAIAHLLDAVDTAIERTRSAVNDASRLRLSLMQAAFGFEFAGAKTRKDSGIGMIPADWDALKGKEAFVVLTGGNSSVDALSIGRSDVHDAWFMKVDDFNAPANRWAIHTTKIGFSTRRNPSFRLLPLNTIVIAKRGAAILKNRVRTTKVPVALDPNLMALQPAPDVLPDFLKYQLEWRNLSRYIESSGVPQLNNKDLYPRWFLKAPKPEQEQIIELITAAERKQEAIETKLTALEQLKKSLMHDLLTGRVRVPLKP